MMKDDPDVLIDAVIRIGEAINKEARGLVTKEDEIGRCVMSLTVSVFTSYLVHVAHTNYPHGSKDGEDLIRKMFSEFLGIAMEKWREPRASIDDEIH